MIRMRDLLLLFGISRVTVYEWIRQGMPNHKVGGLLFFDKIEVEKWVKQHHGIQ